MLRRPLVCVEVAGNLLAHEAVERFVGVERREDVIAIPIGFTHREVGRLAGRVRVAHNIEPVPAPTFPVGRRRKQSIDDFREGVRRAVRHEGFNIVRGGRKARKIKRGSADQRAFVSGADGFETCRLEPGQDESIDGCP